MSKQDCCWLLQEGRKKVNESRPGWILNVSNCLVRPQNFPLVVVGERRSHILLALSFENKRSATQQSSSAFPHSKKKGKESCLQTERQCRRLSATSFPSSAGLSQPTMSAQHFCGPGLHVAKTKGICQYLQLLRETELCLSAKVSENLDEILNCRITPHISIGCVGWSADEP